MSRRPVKKKTDPWTIAFVVLIFILVLKALGILKTYLNIDPDGITFTFDIGYLTSAGLFVLLWRRFEKINDKLSEQIRKQGERIAKIEGMLEKQ